MRRYEAVIFDLHGTLIPWCKVGFRAMLSNAASVLGVDDEGFARTIGELADESMTGRFPSMADEFIHVCRSLDANADYDAVEQAAQLWMDFHWQNYENPYPGAVSLLQNLKEDGLKIGLVTNCSIDTPGLWARSQFAPLVDAAVFSSVEGVVKPNRLIYLAACERLGIMSDRCLFVDDSVASLCGAEDIGMHPVLLRHPGNTLCLAGIDKWDGPKATSLNEVLNCMRQ